jgi:UDP-N-acetylglucosamine 1-carboxyvinyltransferase
MRVMIFGTFDHLHDGHRFLIHEGLRRGSLVVVVARDHNVASIKGRTPDQSESERMRAIQEEFPSIMVTLGDGESTLFGLEYLDRGYEQFEIRLRKLGAKIKRIEQN